MQFSELKIFSANADKNKSSYYSDALRLRANYLIYFLGQELSADQKQYLHSCKVPWAEYENMKAIEGVLSFLKSVEGGLYMPQLDHDLLSIMEKVCIFLLDPHLIDEFENKITEKRLGVLIRRPILASLNFKEIVNL